MEKFEQSGLPEKKADGFAAELLAMAQFDQEARRHWQETGEMWDRTLDEKNTERLKKIVEEIGWPTRSKVGSDGAYAAWLLVQHADDPEFQSKCLDLMQQAPEGEVEKQNRAFLEDRVRVNTNRPTLYGTQFGHNAEGWFGPFPIEDRENLDKRRAAMDLGPFKDYEQEMQQLNQGREKEADRKN